MVHITVSTRYRWINLLNSRGPMPFILRPVTVEPCETLFLYIMKRVPPYHRILTKLLQPGDYSMFLQVDIAFHRYKSEPLAMISWFPWGQIWFQRLIQIFFTTSRFASAKGITIIPPLYTIKLTCMVPQSHCSSPLDKQVRKKRPALPCPGLVHWGGSPISMDYATVLIAKYI